MVEAREDNEIAFTVKVFAFDNFVHCNSFIASVPYGITIDWRSIINRRALEGQVTFVTPGAAPRA
jgi:hypothetical protein